MTRGRLWIGTSGWQYDDWRDRFYAGVPRKRWLEHYAAHFRTVEINNTFYRLPESKTFEQWRDRTPGDFVFAVKMSRYLTHVKRLRDPAEPVATFFERAGRLGPKLGPVLLQLPPNLRAAPEHNAALCLADRESRPLGPTWKTADWTYLRFHSGRGTPHPCYGRTALRSWSRRLAAEWSGGEVYAYFNNDPHGCAVKDAHTFERLARADAWEPTRVP